MIPLWTDLLQALNVYRELVKLNIVAKKDAQGDVNVLKFTKVHLIWNSQNYVNILCNVQIANHVDLLQILHWFCEKSTGWYYEGVSRTTITYKVEHCVKNDEIRAFSNPYFPIIGQNRKKGENKGIYGYDSVDIDTPLILSIVLLYFNLKVSWNLRLFCLMCLKNCWLWKPPNVMI